MRIKLYFLLLSVLLSGTFESCQCDGDNNVSNTLSINVYRDKTRQSFLNSYVFSPYTRSVSLSKVPVSFAFEYVNLALADSAGNRDTITVSFNTVHDYSEDECGGPYIRQHHLRVSYHTFDSNYTIYVQQGSSY